MYFALTMNFSESGERGVTVICTIIYYIDFLRGNMVLVDDILLGKLRYSGNPAGLMGILRKIMTVKRPFRVREIIRIMLEIQVMEDIHRFDRCG